MCVDSLQLLQEPAEKARAVSFMVAGYPQRDQLFYLETLAGMLESEEKGQDLIVVEAIGHGQRIGAALGQQLPGRAALIWPLRAIDEGAAPVLLQRVLEELRRCEVALVQALFDVDRSEQAAVFLAAGFHDAGTLVYMAADEEVFPDTIPMTDLDFDIVDPSDPELAQVIEASYRGSLDCPAIDGWRAMNDIVEGYLKTGVHRPELWRLVRRQEETVGCLLLADFPEQARGELVYLGIRPEYRGRGWGLLITRWALHLARQQGWKHVILAVDSANGPAKRLYQDAGFQDVLEKRVLVYR